MTRKDKNKKTISIDYTSTEKRSRMKISKSLNLFLVTILLTIFSGSLFSQKLEPKKRITVPDHTISSQLTGNDYHLYLSFPSSYSIKDTTTYPVLYFLDGNASFPIFKQSQINLSLGNEIEDVIIVGISSGSDMATWIINRTYDYSPIIDTMYTKSLENDFGFPKELVKTGGGDKFLTCIKTEIAPFIDKHYKTNSDRGIAGNSLGGFFAAYCLINSDGYFTRFGLNSPSLWWGNEQLLDQAVSKYTSKETLDIPASKVFVCGGRNENYKDFHTMVKFCSYLEASNYENIDLKWKIFDDETHLSVVPASISKAISTLYNKE